MSGSNSGEVNVSSSSDKVSSSSTAIKATTPVIKCVKVVPRYQKYHRTGDAVPRGGTERAAEASSASSSTTAQTLPPPVNHPTVDRKYSVHPTVGRRRKIVDFRCVLCSMQWQDEESRGEAVPRCPDDGCRGAGAELMAD